MRFGSQLLPQTQCSQVQVIDAFANYFKHHEEWHGSWGQLTDQAGRTVQVLSAVGADQYSTGNFRMAADKLGNKRYENLEVFSSVLRDWGRVVHEQYNAELRSKNLL